MAGKQILSQFCKHALTCNTAEIKFWPQQKQWQNSNWHHCTGFHNSGLCARPFKCFSSSKWDSFEFMGQTHSSSQQAEVWFGSTELSEESNNVRVPSVSLVIRLQHAFRCLHGDVLIQFLHSSLLQTAAVSTTLSVSVMPTVKQNPQTSTHHLIADLNLWWITKLDKCVVYGIH